MKAETKSLKRTAQSSLCVYTSACNISSRETKRTETPRFRNERLSEVSRGRKCNARVGDQIVAGQWIDYPGSCSTEAFRSMQCILHSSVCSKASKPVIVKAGLSPSVPQVKHLTVAPRPAETLPVSLMSLSAHLVADHCKARQPACRHVSSAHSVVSPALLLTGCQTFSRRTETTGEPKQESDHNKRSCFVVYVPFSKPALRLLFFVTPAPMPFLKSSWSRSTCPFRPT